MPIGDGDVLARICYYFLESLIGQMPPASRVKGCDDNIDRGRLRRVIDNPRLKVIPHAVTTKHYVIKIDEVATIFAAVVYIETTFVLKALREESQHLPLALPVLLYVQEVRRRPVLRGGSPSQLWIGHEATEKVIYVLSCEESLLDNVVKFT